MISFHEAAEQYLATRRALGLKFYWPGLALRDFVSFLQREGASHITTELAMRWAKQPSQARSSHWENRVTVVRGFARHMSALDTRTEIPPAGLLSHGPRRRTPYIYTDEEIRRLMEAAQSLPGLRGWTCATMIGLIATTGLRLGEACKLDRTDVDLDQGILTIRQTKFGKSRLVPVHPTTRTALAAYACQRDQRFRMQLTQCFFVSDRGARVTKLAVWSTFVRISEHVRFNATTGHRRPRLHDLRHTFAVKTLVGWYREGRDVEQSLPVLSTYLGHSLLGHTYWYFSAVPELLGWARVRLERRLEGVPS